MLYTDPFGLAGESYLYGQTCNEHRWGAQSQIEINSTLLAELVCTPQYSSYHSVSYVNDITLLGGWNNYIRQAQYHTAVSNYGMMYNQNNLISTNVYTASRDWDLRLGDWLRNTFDSHSEEGEQQRMATSILPILQGTALFIPPVGITNDIHTLTQGKDIYGNGYSAIKTMISGYIK